MSASSLGYRDGIYYIKSCVSAGDGLFGLVRLYKHRTSSSASSVMNMDSGIDYTLLRYYA